VFLGLPICLSSAKFFRAEQCGAYFCHTIWNWCFGKDGSFILMFLLLVGGGLFYDSSNNVFMTNVVFCSAVIVNKVKV